jgi:hypothetical protein
MVVHDDGKCEHRLCISTNLRDRVNSRVSIVLCISRWCGVLETAACERCEYEHCMMRSERTLRTVLCNSIGMCHTSMLQCVVL